MKIYGDFLSLVESACPLAGRQLAHRLLQMFRIGPCSTKIEVDILMLSYVSACGREAAIFARLIELSASAVMISDVLVYDMVRQA